MLVKGFKVWRFINGQRKYPHSNQTINHLIVKTLILFCMVTVTFTINYSDDEIHAAPRLQRGVNSFEFVT